MRDVYRRTDGEPLNIKATARQIEAHAQTGTVHIDTNTVSINA